MLAFQRLLLEEPAGPAAALAAVGVVLLLVGRQRMQRNVMTAGGIALALSLAVVAAAMFVTTDREAVHALTETLVHDTAPLNLTGVEAALDQRAVLVGPDDSDWASRQQILDGLSAAPDKYPLESHSIKSLDVTVTAPAQAHALVDVLTLARNGRVLTRWMIYWRKQPGGHWLVTRIQWLDQPHPMGIRPSPCLLYTSDAADE